MESLAERARSSTPFKSRGSAKRSNEVVPQFGLDKRSVENRAVVSAQHRATSGEVPHKKRPESTYHTGSHRDSGTAQHKAAMCCHQEAPRPEQAQQGEAGERPAHTRRTCIVCTTRQRGTSRQKRHDCTRHVYMCAHCAVYRACAACARCAALRCASLRAARHASRSFTCLHACSCAGCACDAGVRTRVQRAVCAVVHVALCARGETSASESFGGGRQVPHPNPEGSTRSHCRKAPHAQAHHLPHSL